ncbi:MAG: tetratricopeptide repeat protein [Bacteriovoracia bacterium]
MDQRPKRVLLSAISILLIAFLSGCAHRAPQVKKAEPEELSKLNTDLGTQALLRADYSQAVEDLRRAVSLNPKNGMAHNHLGLAYFGLQRKDLAKQEFEKAVEINPSDSDAYINLGTMATDEKNHKLAKHYYQKALDNLEYRMRHRALTNLAQVYITENNLDEAKRLLFQSLQHNPDYCLSHFLLGSVYSRENNPKKAADEFKASVAKTCVANPEGHYQLGVAYMKSRQYDKARSTFVFLIQEFPESKQASKAGNELRNIP